MGGAKKGREGWFGVKCDDGLAVRKETQKVICEEKTGMGKEKHCKREKSAV
jgi:hypothetical protein